MTLVGLSKFVIADLSGPSVANELSSTVPHFKIPFVPILETGKHPYAMFIDFQESDWVLPIVEYTNKEHLLNILSLKIIEPAEQLCTERLKRLHQIFGKK